MRSFQHRCVDDMNVDETTVDGVHFPSTVASVIASLVSTVGRVTVELLISGE